MRPFKLLKLFDLFTLRSTRYTLILLSLFTFLPFLPLQSVYAAPQQADYCYLPPFVTDPNTPPNIAFIYEKTADIKKRAYSTSYLSSQTYYGFFDSSVNYNWDSTNHYFYKPSTACTPSATALGCISGNVLNWALMSALDISRKAIIGFGWPEPGGGGGGGDVFTYSGNFCSAWDAAGTTCTNADKTPLSYGQWEDGNTMDLGVTMSLGGTNYSYVYCLSKTTGSNPTGLKIRVKSGTTVPGCTGGSGITDIISTSGQVAVKFHKVCSNNSAKVCTADSDCTSPGTCNEEERRGIIQKYGDKDKNYQYDSDAPRFAIRRWHTGQDKQEDIRKNTTLTDAESTSYLKTLLTAASKAPPSDTATSLLGNMMDDLIDYFNDDGATSIAYSDNDSWTQSPYNWKDSDSDTDANADPATQCRKTFAIFITTGNELLTADTTTPVLVSTPAHECNSIATFDYPKTCIVNGDCPAGKTCTSGICSTTSYTCSHAFEKNACYAFKTDFKTTAGTQNIRTYILHTAFYGAGATYEPYLACAANAGGGEYMKVDDPANFQSKLEEALLNILSTSASASTVATLTTQTRESSTLTQAYFYPKKEGTDLKWIGYLRLLWSDGGANLREDTANRAWLDLKKDKILSFWYSSASTSYKAKLYDDADGDQKIDACVVPTDANTISTDDIASIWNAQSKLMAGVPSDRTIKVGIGNTSGFVNSSQLLDFTTGIKATVQPFWSWASSCSDNTSRWCNTTAAPYSDCFYCSTGRACSGGTNPECNYCTTDTSRVCTAPADCSYCTINTSRNCSATNPDCNYCQNTALDPSDAINVVLRARTCTAGAAPVQACRYCSTDTNISCTLDADCPGGGTCLNTSDINCISATATVGSYTFTGSTCTADTCNTTATCDTTPTCNVECDQNCAESVIKYVQGYDRPTNTSGTPVTYPGSKFRLRHTPAVSGSDLTSNINKLGDIVYSTPRISPNSAINGYDVTYKDSTYSDWINSKIKGTCTTAADCPGTSDKTSSEDQTCPIATGVCTGTTTIGDGYTPIVILGANDGMVHAFKVSKIKDLSPTEDDCYNEHSGTNSCADPAPDVTSGTGSQVARFADKPHSVKTSDSGTGTDKVPPSDIGKELWAYIPFNAVPFLKWYCDKNYCHIPMVDARFTVIDASIDYDKDGTIKPEGGGAGQESRLATNNRCDTGASPTSPCPNYPWRRLLVGAMGVGGKKITVGSNTWSSSIFVLDITNPTNPVLLWERPLPDNTLTTSNPATIVRLGADTANGKWYVVMGSGAESITTNKLNYKTTDANIYVFDLRTGNWEATLPIETGVAQGVAVGDMMAVDYDSDYQVDDIYFGTYGGTTGAYKGKFYRLRLRDDPNPATKTYLTTPSTWIIETVVVPGGGNGRPIFAASEVAQDADRNIWLYFGTGVYLTLEHAAATPSVNEYLYAVKETEGCWRGSGASCTYSSFLDTSGMNFTGAKAVELGCFCAGSLLGTVTCTSPGVCGTCAAYPNTDTVVLKVQEATLTKTAGVGDDIPTNCSASPNNTDTSAIACLTAAVNASYNGWRRAITGQKSFSKPFVAGGLVDFTTFQPTATSCSLGGNTHLYALHYTTGTPYVQPTIFLAGGATQVGGSLSNITINASVNLGIGVPPLGESLVALPLAGDTYKVITQVSGGLPGTSMSPSLPAKGGYVLWIVK
ncbi:MAG: PilC/PilY family type IV pilus protein [Thermodesulfovibrionales bacterium]